MGLMCRPAWGIRTSGILGIVVRLWCEVLADGGFELLYLGKGTMNYRP